VARIPTILINEIGDPCLEKVFKYQNVECACSMSSNTVQPHDQSKAPLMKLYRFRSQVNRQYIALLSKEYLQGKYGGLPSTCKA